MHILVLGGGGREHALIKALKLSPKIKHLSSAPGNPGIALDATCNLTDPMDTRRVIELAKRLKPDLIVIGPEAPLAAGVSDALRHHEFLVFGPSQSAARLETSKVFSKDFMVRHGVPTARAKVCHSFEEMIAAKSEFHPPYVVKADGLAAGKGVRICQTDDEYAQTASDFFEKKVLGDAAKTVLIEEFTEGEELSLMLLVSDGHYTLLPVSQDHKKLLDGDQGPNTGGMGAFAPVKKWNKRLAKIEETLIKPTMAGLLADKIDYRGVLYIGAMISDKNISALEYNVRFGDPEAQVLLPLLEGDWADAFMKVSQGKIPKLEWKNEFAVCVVLAAPGYPETPQKGIRITIDREAVNASEKQYVLQAATSSYQGLFSNGGRVLNTVARDKTLAGARKKAYDIIKAITFEGVVFRTDIALETEPTKVKTPKPSKAKK